jgi:hypothetical protein
VNETTKLSEAEKALTEWRVPYQKQPDGTLLVKGTILLSHRKLYDLPDLTNVIVKGDFYCDSTRIASLKGAPRVVEGGFFCGSNDLVDLKGAPERVGGDFYCGCNPLHSLEGAPKAVGRDFFCQQTPLTSLAGAPAEVGRIIWCAETQLRNLEHAPEKFQGLRSRFGDFNSPEDIPPALRHSPETLKRREAERQATLARQVKDSTELRRTIVVAKPLRLKKPGL